MAVNDPSPLTDLRRHLNEPGPWADRFRQLASDIVAANAIEDADRSGASPPTCDEIEAILDRFVDDELNDRADETFRTRVRRHLATCPHCRLSFTLLIETLSRERTGQPPSVPAPASLALSFLRQPDERTPWITRLKSKLIGATFGLSIAFDPSHLRSMLTSSLPAFAIRADEAIAPPTTRLLMSDTLQIDDRMWAVEVTARPSSQPDRIILQAIITGSGSLPPNLWANLTWANQTYQAPMNNEGQAIFDAVPLAPLSTAARDFELAFEVRESANDDA